MRRRAIRYLLTPGEVPSWLAVLVGILAMFSLYALDAGDHGVVSLHSLYIFPLVMIVIHCPRPAEILLGLATAITLQAVTLLEDDVPMLVLRAELMLALVSSGLMILLASAARLSFLETASQAAHDPLTGLLNRRSFQTIMDAEIGRQRRYGGVFSLVMIDLDDFKRLNDARSHQVGDEALAWLADILRRKTRQTDAVCRLGGDEFAIMMPNTGASECGALCDALIAMIAFEMAAAKIELTASIGYAAFEVAPVSSSSALQRIDRALYAAKAGGKSRAIRA